MRLIKTEPEIILGKVIVTAFHQSRESSCHPHPIVTERYSSEGGGGRGSQSKIIKGIPLRCLSEVKMSVCLSVGQSVRQLVHQLFD